MTADMDRIVELAMRQLGQVTLVAAVAAVAIRWACRRRPHLAYLLGLIVLVKCWMPPILSSYGGIFCWPPATGFARGEAAEERIPTVASDHVPVTPVSLAKQMPGGETPNEPAGLAPYRPPAPQVDVAAAEKMTIVALALWMLGVVYLLSRACVIGRRWRNSIQPLPRSETPAVDRVAGEVAWRLGLVRPPRLIVTATATGPAVFGLLRPTIVVPRRLLADPDKKTLALVLAHEMAHLRRGDLYVGLFQFATQTVWWFHPFVWWISRQLTRERERLCDEAVLAALRCPAADYAQCLLDVLRLKRQPPLSFAWAGMRAVDVTGERLEHIMQPSLRPRRRMPPACWLIAILALWLVLPGARLNVVVADDPTAADEPRQREAPATPPAQPQPSERPAATNADAPKEPPNAMAKAGEATPAAEDGEEPTADKQAIDRGVQFLLSQQYENGKWPDPIGYPGGVSGLCALALLKAGVKPDDPAMQKAIAFLEPIKPSMTYSTSLQTLVFCAADPQAYQERIKRNVEWLANKQKEQGPLTGAWGYPQAEGDNSNTAFAVWALFEADRVGIKVEKTVWRRTLDYFLKHQNANGSWGYKPLVGGTGSMTGQGLYCVAAAAKVLGEDLPDEPAARSIELAAGWLTSNFEIDHNPGLRGANWQFYYRLALAKAGRISGKSKFGDHDWFAEGAKSLLDSQRPNGSWAGPGHAEDDPHVATSMAILFLASGRGR